MSTPRRQYDAGMPCPSCGGRMYVNDSRRDPCRDKSLVRRQRHCRDCGHHTLTFEVAATRAELNALRNLIDRHSRTAVADDDASHAIKRGRRRE
jgi:C4-type Zn-finger protein